MNQPQPRPAGHPIESLAAVVDAMRDAHTNPAPDRPRLTEQEALTATDGARTAGDQATRRYATQLWDRYHTIAGLATIHGHGAVNPDRLYHVVEEMRHLAETYPADAHTATHDAVTAVRADETYADEFHSRATQLGRVEDFQRQLTEAHQTADRYEAERARIEQRATTAAAELRAQADLDRISEQVDRHHRDGGAPFRAEPVAEDVQEAGR